MANTPRPIDWDRVEHYIKAGSSLQKIADSLSVDRETLRRRLKAKYGVNYAEYVAALSSEGELNIMAAQYQKALKSSSPGNTQMLIWLGKVRLGQREPELISSTPPMQSDIDRDHIIMELKNKIANLEANGNQP